MKTTDLINVTYVKKDLFTKETLLGIKNIFTTFFTNNNFVYCSLSEWTLKINLKRLTLGRLRTLINSSTTVVQNVIPNRKPDSILLFMPLMLILIFWGSKNIKEISELKMGMG